jgi:hypothetical protein
MASRARVVAGAQQARCLVPGCDGVLYEDLPSREALWDKYYMGAPARQWRCVERSNSVKRAEPRLRSVMT